MAPAPAAPARFRAFRGRARGALRCAVLRARAPTLYQRASMQGWGLYSVIPHGATLPLCVGRAFNKGPRAAGMHLQPRRGTRVGRSPTNRRPRNDAGAAHATAPRRRCAARAGGRRGACLARALERRAPLCRSVRAGVGHSGAALGGACAREAPRPPALPALALSFLACLGHVTCHSQDTRPDSDIEWGPCSPLRRRPAPNHNVHSTAGTRPLQQAAPPGASLRRSLGMSAALWGSPRTCSSASACLCSFQTALH